LGIGEGLLAGRPKRKPGMCPHGLQKHHDCLGDRMVVAPNMQIPQQLERIGDPGCFGRNRSTVDRPHRVEATSSESTVRLDFLPKKQKSLVIQGEERPAERCKNAQLVVGPLDCGKRIAKSNDFLAFVERSPAHQHVRNTAALQLADVNACDILAKIAEAAEEDRDMAGRSTESSDAAQKRLVRESQSTPNSNPVASQRVRGRVGAP
jgi:hypothetical protein